MTDPFYSDADHDSPFFREELSERSSRALCAFLKAGGSIINFPRDHAISPGHLRSNIDRAIAGMETMNKAAE